jgi:hypothetical protein
MFSNGVGVNVVYPGDPVINPGRKVKKSLSWSIGNDEYPSPGL